MKTLIVVALLVTTALSFGVKVMSREAPSDRVELRIAWWGNPVRDRRTLAVIRLYQIRNPHVKIHPEIYSWPEYWRAMRAKADLNNLPDLMQQDYSYLRDYVESGLVQRIDEFRRNGVLHLTGIPDPYLDSGIVNGSLYGVSLGMNAPAVVYDPAAVKAAGLDLPATNWTWDDFSHMAREIHETSGLQTMPLFVGNPRVMLENMVRQRGWPMFDTDSAGVLGISDPDLLEQFFEIQVELLEEGVLLDPVRAFDRSEMGDPPFVAVDSWVDFYWSNQFEMVQEASERELRLALLPRVPLAWQPGTFLKPSMFLSLTRDAKDATEAVRFMDFFLNDHEANAILLGERGVPIVPSVRDAIEPYVSPAMREVFGFISLVGDGNQSPIGPPDPPWTAEFVDMLRETVLLVLTDQLSTDEAVYRVQNWTPTTQH